MKKLFKVVLVIVLLITGIFMHNLYQEYRQFKESKLQEYNRETRYMWGTLRLIRDELNVLMSSNDIERKKQILWDIRRMSIIAGETFSRHWRDLPGPSIMEQTQIFYQMAEYAKILLSEKDLSQPFTEKELENLKLAHEHIRIFNNAFQQLLNLINTGEGDWFATKDPDSYGYKIVENLIEGLRALPSMDYKRQSDSRFYPPIGYKGPEVTPKEALEIARAFINDDDLADSLAISGGGTSQLGEYYGVSPIGYGGGDPEIRIEVSVKGGHLISLSHPVEQERKFFNVKEKSMDLSQAKRKAEDYLKHWGEASLVLMHSSVEDNVARLQYAPVQDDIPLYPDRWILRCRWVTANY